MCAQCGFLVRGGGYTNHCSRCLWSKHVDIYPGDRRAVCGGMMRPIRLEKKGEGYVILHRCLLCGAAKKNTSSPEDNFDALLKLGAR